MSANLGLRDDAIRHAIGLHRYGSGVSRDVYRILDKARAEIIAEIARRAAALDPGQGVPYTLARLEELLPQIEATMLEAGRAVGVHLSGEMGRLAAAEEAHQVGALVRRTGIPEGVSQFSWTRLTADQLASIVTAHPLDGHLLAGWVDGLASAHVERITRSLRVGVVQGQTIPQLTRRVRDLQNWSRRSAESVVRTAVNGFSTEARGRMMSANGHLLKGVQIVATLDTRTTPICRYQDNRVYPVESGPRPPFHVGCRTTTAPLVKSLRAIGASNLPDLPAERRRALDGFQPVGEGHSGWLRRQPRADQNEILGIERAEIFRERKSIDLARLIDAQRNRYWTLEELQSRI